MLKKQTSGPVRLAFYERCGIPAKAKKKKRRVSRAWLHKALLSCSDS